MKISHLDHTRQCLSVSVVFNQTLWNDRYRSVGCPFTPQM